MNFSQQESSAQALAVMGLTAWASLTLLFMLVRSWTAANWFWVTVLAGLMCFSAGLGLNTWRLLFLSGERGEQGAGE